MEIKSQKRNNTVLRRLRYALKISDEKMIEVFSKVGYEIRPFLLRAYLHKESHEGFVECPDEALAAFLDGLILERRGAPREGASKNCAKEESLSNNLILKKLKIALKLREQDMLQIMEMAEKPVSKSQISALFRRKGQRNYRPCGNQFLRNFITGLTYRLRGKS